MTKATGLLAYSVRSVLESLRKRGVAIKWSTNSGGGSQYCIADVDGRIYCGSWCWRGIDGIRCQRLEGIIMDAPAKDIAFYLAALESLSADDLRLRWLELYGTLPVRRVSRSLLLRTLAMCEREEDIILDLMERNGGATKIKQ